MKRVFQYRYYYEPDSNGASQNIPKSLNMKDLATGGAFASTTKYIYQLGIQAIPGTKVYINSPYDGDPVIINKSGIFEIEVDNQAAITSLRVEKASVQKIHNMNTEGFTTPVTNAYLIIDVVYDDDRD